MNEGGGNGVMEAVLEEIHIVYRQTCNYGG